MRRSLGATLRTTLIGGGVPMVLGACTLVGGGVGPGPAPQPVAPDCRSSGVRISLQNPYWRGRLVAVRRPVA